MITIELNGRKIETTTSDSLLNIITKNGIQVPSLCHMKGMLPTGACRLCVVEIDGYANLVPSCSATAVDGMKIQTHSHRVLKARKTIVELLLSNHPDDCLFCPRNLTCELQSLAQQLGITHRAVCGEKSSWNKDDSSASIIRDPKKCILCGKCVRVCSDVQSVSAIDFIGRGCETKIGTAFDEGLNTSNCVNCGQCIRICPTSALIEQNHVSMVEAALQNKDLFVVVQHAPAVSATIAEHLGVPSITDANGSMVAGLRRLGFKRVYDTSFSADVTVLEEVTELLDRLKNKRHLPMFSSCSPGWVKFVEHFYPEFIPHMSSCKSPQQMLGALIKSVIAAREEIDPAKIFSVSIMPCTAKKFEAQRPEMTRNGIADIDAVLTTRELLTLFKKYGLSLQSLAPEEGDNPFSEHSSAGKLFGITGGVMESALRTAHFLVTGKEVDEQTATLIRNLHTSKYLRLHLGDTSLGVAVVSGLNNARALFEQIKTGRNDLHFVEVMTCPGGCIAGGGQPFSSHDNALNMRMNALYNFDKNAVHRTAHTNSHVQKLYDDFLGKPLGPKSHALLHTHYQKRVKFCI